MDIGELIQQEKLREQINAAKAEEEARNQAALRQNPVGPSQVMQAIKPAILPTLGAIGGTVAGMATGPFAPAAVPTLESAGGMLGEGLNQALGITEPSMAQIGIQGALPILGRGISAARTILPAATKGATMLQDIAPDVARRSLGEMKPPVTASTLFQQAEAQGHKIPTLNTQQVIKDSADKYLVGGTASGEYKATRDYLDKLGRTLQRKKGALTPTQYQTELADLRTMLGKAKTPPEQAALSNVKAELERALDIAPQGTTLAQARKVSLQEHTLKDLGDMMIKAESNVAGNEVTKFSPQNVLNKIRKDETFSKKFAKAFDPKERQKITSIFEHLNQYPALPTTQVNTNNLLSDVFRGGRAGIAATMLGADPAVASGVGIASTLTRPVMDTSKVIKLALSTPEGRDVLLGALKANRGRPLNEVVQRVATALSSTQTAQDTVRQEFGGSSAIRPFPNQQ